ncbi:MAG: hypothetical protein V4793_35830 [Paraburkholderia tropica]|nr:hypothetical protein [Burkholderia gladioli]
MKTLRVSKTFRQMYNNIRAHERAPVISVFLEKQIEFFKGHKRIEDS